MMPMWEALKPKKVSEQQEKFGLYIVDYVRRDEAEGLLNPEFQNSLDYPPQLLLFVSENQVYHIYKLSYVNNIAVHFYFINNKICLMCVSF